MPRFTKSERLRSKVHIRDLFEKGYSFPVPPIRVFWIPAEEEAEHTVQVLISVPKKNFRQAVTRNLLKRRIREIYRKNKSELHQSLNQLNRKCRIAFIYTGRDIMKSSELEPKIIVILQRLIQENVKHIG